MVLSAASSLRVVRSRCLERVLGEFGAARALCSSSGSGASASAGKRSGEKKGRGKRGKQASGKQAASGGAEHVNPEEIEELNTFSALGGMGVAAFGAVGLAAIGAIGAFQMAKWAAGEAGYTITGQEAQAKGTRSFANSGSEE